MSTFARFVTDRWGDYIDKTNKYEENLINRLRPYLDMCEEHAFIAQNMSSGDYGIVFEVEYPWQRGNDDEYTTVVSDKEAIAQAGDMALKLCDIAEANDVVHSCALILGADDYVFNRRLGLHFFISAEHMKDLHLFLEPMGIAPPNKTYNVHVNRKMTYQVAAKNHIEATQIITDEWAGLEGGSAHHLINDEIEQAYAEEAKQ
jgi:hypothetical protein